MITCKVVNRTKDRKVYTLMDVDGVFLTIKADVLRKKIRNGELNVINLTLSSDGKLILRTEDVAKKSKLIGLVAMIRHKVDTDKILEKAINIGLRAEKVYSVTEAYSILISEGNNHLLYIPDNVIFFNGSISGDNIAASYKNGVSILEGSLRNRKGTSYLQQLKGNLTVIGGEELISAPYMFALCDFNTINLRYFNTSKIENMEGMFYGCKVKSVDLSKFSVKNASNLPFMFANSYFEQGLDVSSFYTDGARIMAHMFNGCKSKIRGLTSLSYATAFDFTGMFANTQIDYVTYDLLKDTFKDEKKMAGMFYNCTAETINFSNGDLSFVSTMKEMFSQCHIKNVNFSGAKFSYGTNMRRMFECSYIGTIDFSQITTKYPLIAGSMFNFCIADNINWSNDKTIEFKEVFGMFAGTDVKGPLDLSAFETSEVIDMRGMFIACRAESIDVSYFDTRNVLNMGGMFSSCVVKELDLYSFNARNTPIENMETMFYNYRGILKAKDDKVLDVYADRKEEELDISEYYIEG